MNKFIATISLCVLTLGSTVHAQNSIFGEPGTGQPTKTVLGLIGGAATGAAIGEGFGGKDGWWIGALTGATVGGAAGNAWGSADTYRTRSGTGTYYRTHSRPATCGTRFETVYTTQPVVVERTTVYSQTSSAPSDSVPYGFMESGMIRSPWSDFSMSVGGKTRGQVLFDPNTGQPFRVP